MIPLWLAGAHLVAVCEKKPIVKGWPNNPLSLEAAKRRLAAGMGVAFRVGEASGGVVDADLDCPEAPLLADTYLPPTPAEFERASKLHSHRLYRSPGAVFASFPDPTTGEMLLELRAAGRDGGAHLTTIPSSPKGGEPRRWCGEPGEPAVVDAAVLTRRMAWLAIGCLVMRHISEHAARRPGPDLPDLLS